MKRKTGSREKMIQAACMLFQAKGFHATGLNEILEKSGAPKGSLYYHFPNGKEELALAAVELASEIIQGKIQEGLSRHSDPVLAIEEVIKNMALALESDGKLQNISISLIAMETYLTSETLRKACKQSFAALEERYAAKLLEAGMAEDMARELGLVIQLMIEGGITVAVTQKDTLPLLMVADKIRILINHYV